MDLQPIETIIRIVETFKNVKGSEGCLLFFIGLTFSQMLLITGMVLLFLQSYLVGGPVLLLGALSSYVFVQFYQKRKKERGRKKKKERDWDCCGSADCIDIPLPKKLDCDCSPDCSN